MKRRRKKNAKPSLDITLDGLFFPPRILCVHLTEPVDGFAYSRVLHLRTIHTIFDHHWCMSSKHRVQKNKVRWTLFERKQHNTNHKQNKKTGVHFLEMCDQSDYNLEIVAGISLSFSSNSHSSLSKYMELPFFSSLFLCLMSLCYS